MKEILTAPFVKEMQKTTRNIYRLGWDERNGGNISYMLDNDEVGEYIDLTKVIRTIHFKKISSKDKIPLEGIFCIKHARKFTFDFF